MNETPLSRADALRRASIIRDVSYRIDLDLTQDDGDTFGSTSQVTFTCDQPGESTFLELVATEVESVQLNGTVLHDVHQGGRILLEGLQEHNEVTVTARCGYSRAGVGLHRFVDPVDGETFLYTQFEPQDARRVFACFDQPDLKAPVTVLATAPQGWEVISNGAVVDRPEEGQAGRWTFAETAPISTYIVALVAGPYHRVNDRHGDVELGVYCRRSMAEHLDPDEIFQITKDGLDYFADAFGMPYPFGKYDQLFVPEFNFGAMENPGCVTFSERYVFRSRVTAAARMSRANTILHEMAHMWFGDLVTMRWWDDLWLNESFATFMAHSAVADTTDYGQHSWSDFAQSMKAWAYRQDQLPSTHPIVADVPDTETVMANFDGITYAKGASVLKQLNAWVGPEAFLAGLKEYFPAHAYGNASLNDFLNALEVASGRDLGAWSRAWLETAGVATLELQVEVDESEVMTAVSLVQVAPEAHPTLRPHRLAIGLYDTLDGQLSRVGQVQVDIEGASTPVPSLEGRFRPELLLVNDDDLAYAKVRLDDVSITTLERALGTMPDGLARAVCWGSLWDATRDGEMPARQFADLVCEHGTVEEDIGVLQTLLQQALACANRYGAPDNRGAVLDRIGKAAGAALFRAEPGSDRQLVWIRALISTHTAPDRVAALLRGEEVVEGLAVDTDLRWFALTHLAATGDVVPDDIAEEERRDPSDLGARHAESARAAFPDAAAKERAWSRALDRDLAMHTRRAALGGMWQVGQEHLLREYATQSWVDVLPQLWDGVASEEGLAMTNSIFPDAMIDPQVVQAAERALSLDLPGLARRAIVEGLDGTQRALRARATDH